MSSQGTIVERATFVEIITLWSIVQYYMTNIHVQIFGHRPSALHAISADRTRVETNAF